MNNTMPEIKLDWREFLPGGSGAGNRTRVIVQVCASVILVLSLLCIARVSVWPFAGSSGLPLGGYEWLLAALSIIPAGFRKRIFIDDTGEYLRVAKGFFGLRRVRSYEVARITGVIVSNRTDRQNPTVLLRMKHAHPAHLAYFINDEDASAMADTLALGLGVPKVAQTVKPAKNDIRDRNWLIFVLLTFVFGAGLALMFVWATVSVTVPMVTDCLNARMYQPGKLKEVPCVIDSMRVIQPQHTSSQNEDQITINSGTRVEVSYRYEFNGKSYVGRKYAPIGNNVEGDFVPWPLGYATNCYVNPERPDRAVLVTTSNRHYVLFAVVLNIVFAFFFVAYGLAVKETWKRYQASAGAEPAAEEE